LDRNFSNNNSNTTTIKTNNNNQLNNKKGKMSNVTDMSVIGGENGNDNETNQKYNESVINEDNNMKKKNYWEETSIMKDFYDKDSDNEDEGNWETVKMKSHTKTKIYKNNNNSLYGKKNDVKHTWTPEKPTVVKKGQEGQKNRGKVSNLELHNLKHKVYNQLQNKSLGYMNQIKEVVINNRSINTNTNTNKINKTNVWEQKQYDLDAEINEKQNDNSTKNTSMADTSNAKEKPNIEKKKVKFVTNESYMQNIEENLEESEINKNTETYYQTSWNVIATQNPKSKVIEIRNIIVEIMSELQKTDCNIVLIPTEKKITEERPVIYKPKDIPTNQIGLKKYLESPRIKNNKLMFRVQLASKKAVAETIECMEFKNWKKNNQIRFTISKLTTDRPLYAGFYTEPNPTNQKIGFLESRIKVHLNNSFLEFQVEIVPIFGKGKGNSTLVYMVMTTKEDVDMLRIKLSETSHNIHKFNQWDHFEDLSNLQKLHIVREQQNNNNKYKSMLITGFKNNITIHQEETTTQNDDQSETSQLEELNTKDKWNQQEEMEMSMIQNEGNHSWTDAEDPMRNEERIKCPKDIDKFLKTEYTFPDGTSIIQGTIGPVNGTLQIWYMNTQKNQTESLIKVLKTELARNMTTKCLQATFVNPIQVESTINQFNKWEPTQLLITTPLASQEGQNYSNQRNKQASLNYSLINENEKQATKTTNNEDHSKKLLVDEKGQKSPDNNEQNQMSECRDTRTEDNKNDMTYTEEELMIKMKIYCKMMINENSLKIQNEISNTNEQIIQLKDETKGAILNIEKIISKNNLESNNEILTLKKETKETMDSILRNQECMMKILTGSGDNITKPTKETHTSPRKNPITWYRETINSHGETKENNFLQLLNATINRKTSDWIATPNDDESSCCNEEMEAAGQQ
jgi:hypothetical protein